MHLLPLAAQEGVVVSRDDNRPKALYNAAGFEESVMLVPEGPCRVTAIQFYFGSDVPASDTIYITGDPSEGAVPPTSWVWSYNTLAAFVLQYDGTPGWKTYDISNLGIRSDGYDRIVIQHRLDAGGLRFVFDQSAQKAPYGSFLMDPTTNNSLGFPGVTYLAEGDFMVRLVVEYDFPLAGGSEPQPAPTMVDVTDRAGLVDAAGNVIPSARVSVADIDGDGWDDVVAGSRLWRNNRDGTFRTVDAGISASATAWGDYDNDGDLDCYAARGGETPDILYRNDGGWTFTDVTASAGVSNPMPAITPIWFDLENDGDIDLFVSNGRTGDYPNEVFYPDRLWRNNGDGTFTEITGEAGLAAGEPSPFLDAWGSAAGDYNNDRLVDLFVATYRLAPDLLYRNDGDGTFTETGAETGVRGEPTAVPGYFGHGIGSEFADYDNDGDLDLAVGNLGHPDHRGQYSNPSLIYRNSGGPDYRFEEVHRDLGLKFFEMNSGILWGDFNLDGYLDLFHAQLSYQLEGENGEPARLSRIYLSSGPEGDWRLRDVTWHTGLRSHGAWTAARTDYDRDGDLDLIVASGRESMKLYRNDIERVGSFIGFRLVGATSAGVPKDAYGTRVVVHAGDHSWLRELAGASGGATGTQQTSLLHFGIAVNGEPVSTVDSVVVTWGEGVRYVFTGVETGTEYRIVVGEGELEELEYEPASVGGRETGGSQGVIRSIDVEEDGVRITLPGSAGRSAVVEVVSSVGEWVVLRSSPESAGNALRVTLPQALAAGHYFVRVTSGSAVWTGRFEVE